MNMNINIEDEAKNNLFTYDEFDTPTLYDPYRNNNILKDSNKPPECYNRPHYKTFYQMSRKCQENMTVGDGRRSDNHRVSLKKLLERLEALPSPDRKQKQKKMIENANDKFKTMSIMSSTEPLILKKKSSIFVRTCSDDVNVEMGHAKLSVNVTRSQLTSTPKVGFSRLNQEQIKVRRLIKKKMAEKEEFRMKNKTEKLINFLRENNIAETTKKRENTNSKMNSKKLINFLT